METMTHVMIELFDALDRAGIPYVHFKSNTNLDESFSGKGDFDVLTDASRMRDTERIIGEHNGKRFNPPRLGRYPGVDNWLIFDSDTGIYYHLHLHYQLATGKPLVKDYIIPWNDLLFKTRVRDEKYGIWISEPALELILLSVRSVVKAGWKLRLKSRLGRYSMPKSLRLEFADLRSKADPDRVRELAKAVFPEKDAKEAADLILAKDRLDNAAFQRISSLVRRDFRNSRRMSGFAASVLSTYYVKRRRYCEIRKAHSDNCYMIKKTGTGKGLIVAFIGLDGSGKSTVTKEIRKWLNPKFECKRFYMGSGDGRVPLRMKIVKKLGGGGGTADKAAESAKTAEEKNKASSGAGSTGAISSGAGSHGTGSPVTGSSGASITFLRSPLRYLKRRARISAQYAVVKNNEKKIGIMNRYRMNGGIALMDRYPQCELPGLNDGPKIPGLTARFGGKAYAERMAAREAEAFEIVKEVKPDLIFRLNISAETSMIRKPEQKDIEAFRRKAENLKKITFQNAEIIDINAEQPYEEELLEIKRILWERL